MEDPKNENQKIPDVTLGSNSKKSEQKTDKSTEEIKKVPSTVWKYIVSVFSFKQDKNANVLLVIENIKKDIEFKGYNVWILMCSIVIASIGLNTNSVAVIIGAMLISPLMGPIKGIGLAIGTNNFKLLIYSLINFGVATVVSILVSFIYFKIMPFKDATPEILERTEPVIIAVFIAFFGGLAGIIASVRNDNSTVMPGVAIATALMPPLCVTGYGLAVGSSAFFLGAFYLFFLNALFICLVTIIVIRYLRFPLASYVNKKRERNIKIYFGIFLAIVLIPSGIKFAEVVNKNSFENTAQLFIKEEVETANDDIKIVREDIDFKTKTITVFLGINDYIPENTQNQLRKKMISERFDLQNTTLKIEQDEDKNTGLSIDDYKLFTNELKDRILEKNELINVLKKENKSKELHNYDLISLKNRLNFEDDFKNLKSFSATDCYKVDINGEMDTVLLVITTWNDSILQPNKTEKLKKWIQINLQTKEFELIEKLDTNE